MTTTDPTITIAGLRAQVESLIESIGRANSQCASFCDVIDEARSVVARVEAERDALAAQLAEARAELAAAPKVCAVHSYEHGPGPCMTCGAWPPGTRELIAACRTRIAGLEQAADERSRTGQMSEPERSEWIGAAVAVADALGGSLGPVSGTSGTIDPREWIHFAAGLADRAKKLTARVAELEARPVLTEERLRGALFACADGASDAEVRAILAKLGPVTLPLPAQDMAERLLRAFIEHHGTLLDQKINSKDPSGDVRAEAMSRALASLGAPPTSPPAARPVFAGVSEDELIRLFYVVGTDGIDHGEQCPPIDSSDRNGIRAVLARLEVSLVTPVDLAAIERAAKAYHNTSGEHAVPADALGTGQWRAAVLAMTDAFLAAGIPVTPEVGK